MGNKVINTTSVKLGIYETSTDAQLEGMLGDVKEMEDGRKFRLCRNSIAAALAPGLLVQSKADTAYSEALACGTASAGDTTLTVTVTSGDADLSANDLRDGFFAVCTGSGELGHGRKIKSNTAAAAGADTTLTFYDALTDTIVAASTGVWAYPMYKDVLVHAGTGRVVGMPVCDVPISVAATGYYYFWAQVAGPCPATAAGTTVAGNVVEASATAGTIVTATGGTTAKVVGVALQAFDSAEVGWILLNLE